MHRTSSLKTITQRVPSAVSRKIAIHEAGHAAAIHLGNQQKGLPPVFFRIVVAPFTREVQSCEFPVNASERSIANIEGGRLIHVLPSSFAEATHDFSVSQKQAYQLAFEADIINLLAGPLAEARYVALRDDEPISPNLVNAKALHYYGGSSDLEVVNAYLKCLTDNEELRERKMTELFLAAFNFVNKRSNWLSITALADAILAHDKNRLEHHDIIRILEGGRYTTARPGTVSYG